MLKDKAGSGHTDQLQLDVQGRALGRPLAERMRPQSLEDFVGQTHLLAPGKPLAELTAACQLHSMILWGPPGTGKTTRRQTNA